MYKVKMVILYKLLKKQIIKDLIGTYKLCIKRKAV